MKRFAGLILVFVMLLAALPAMADETRKSGDFRYTLKNNGTATIVGYTGSGDNIIIPQMLDGYTVTAIGDGAFLITDEILNSFEDPYNDLDNYLAIKISVTLPNTIKSIGDFAFYTKNVVSINLPDSLEYIGKGAFVGSNAITYRISANHPTFAVVDGALYDKSQKKLIWGKEDATIPEGIKIIGDYACYEVPNCGINRNGIALPSTIEEIGDYAFYGNSYSFKYGTTDLIFGQNLHKIGAYAFSDINFSGPYWSKDIKAALYIPDTVSEIGEGCFYGFGNAIIDCIYLKIVISQNSQLRKIPDKAFSHYLLSIYFDDDDNGYNVWFGYEDKDVKPVCAIECNAPITDIGEYAFFGTDIQNFNTESVKTLGKGAFMRCNFNSDITVPSSCKTISEDTYMMARTNGYDILIPDGVETIGANAFAVNLMSEAKYSWDTPKPNSISPIRLPTSLTSIAPDAFRDDAEFIVERGSYAYRWAEENARNYSIDGEKQNLDWLNN